MKLRSQKTTSPAVREQLTRPMYRDEPRHFGSDWTHTYTETIFRASPDPNPNMYYLSTISGVTPLASLDESAAIQNIALLRDNGSFDGNTAGNANAIDEGIAQILKCACLPPAFRSVPGERKGCGAHLQILSSKT